MLRHLSSTLTRALQTVRPLLLVSGGILVGILTAGLFNLLPSLQAQSASPLTIQPDTGRVGIGTTNPGNKLHVNNNVRIAPHTNGETLPYQNVSSILSILSGAHGNPSYVSRIQFGNQYVPAGTAFDAIYTYIDWTSGWLYIKNNQQTKIQIGGGDEWGNQNVYINPTGGNVGIGTTTPINRLTVLGSSSVAANFSSPQTATYITFSDAASADAQQVRMGSVGNNLTLWAGDTRHVTLTSGGNLGIGTTAPAQKLDVAGNVNVSGAYSRGGSAGLTVSVAAADLRCGGGTSFSFSGGILVGATPTSENCNDIAETYPSRETLRPGDVVAVDPLQDESLVKTTQPYQTTALGVISTKPYLFPGSEAHKNPLALAGRVPVNVSTENGPIRRGDYLTSASRPGYAMKATKPGRVIGMALQPLADGEGTITVFVNPHWYSPEAIVQATR